LTDLFARTNPPVRQDAVQPAVQSAVEQVTQDRPDLSLALLAFGGGDAVIACAGGASVFLSVGEETEQVGGVAGQRGVVTVLRRAGPDSSFVLLGARAVPEIDETQVFRSVDSTFSSQDMAVWLASMAAARAGSDSTVMVVQIAGRRSEAPAWLGESARRSRLPLYAAAAVLLVIVLAAAGFAATKLPRGNHSSQPPTPAAVPTGVAAVDGLHAVPVNPRAVVLAWNDSPNVDAYNVVFGQRKYSSQRPNLKVSDGIEPGRSYTWWVQGTLHGVSVAVSQHEIYRSPALHVAPALIALSPRGRHVSRKALNLPFCWSRGAFGKSFDLYVVGKKLHSHRLLKRNALVTRGAQLCTKETLPANVSYAWRAGAQAPGYSESWTPWTYFSIVKPRPRATPTSVPLPVIQPTAIPQPVIQPTAVFIQPTAIPYIPPAPVATSPPVFQPPVVQPTAVPAPTSPVLSCPTPPNCT
jgi:hypothetical protein